MNWPYPYCQLLSDLRHMHMCFHALNAGRARSMRRPLIEASDKRRGQLGRGEREADAWQVSLLRSHSPELGR
jgi:hypothetical protein